MTSEQGQQALTLYDKLWQSHIVEQQDDDTCLIYIDRQIIHEVTSPQAFEGIRAAGRSLAHKEFMLAVPDHNVSTDKNRATLPNEENSQIQLDALEQNCKEFGHLLIDESDSGDSFQLLKLLQRIGDSISQTMVQCLEHADKSKIMKTNSYD